MKLAAKLISIIILGIIIILAVDGYFTARQSIALFETDMQQRAHLLGRAMKGLVTDVWLTKGEQRALQLISEVNEEESQRFYIRWVWLNATPDDPYSPRVSRSNLDKVIQGNEASFKERYKNGAGYLYTYVPVKVGGNKQGALELSISLDRLDNYTRSTVIGIFILMGELILAGGFAVLLLGFGMIGQPLNQLIEKVQRVAKGDLSGPLNIRGNNEFSRLATALNIMCEQLNNAQEKVRRETTARIEAMEQLRHADRLKTIGGLASGIAHELGTPLNVVSGRAGLITRGDLTNVELRESAEIIKTQSERMTAIIRQLLNFARRDLPKKAIFDLKQIVLQTINLMLPVAQKQKVSLYFADDDILAMAKVDAMQIQQVLTNLIVNALHAMIKEGKVQVGIRKENARHTEDGNDSEKDYFCVYVQDEGIGIQEKDIKNIFDPFFTTKDTGHGTGLGLSIAYGIIQEHGGWIEVKSTPGEGSCFSVYLPSEV
ncbi:MAG: sensor histidine kinase [Smithella sp.]